MQIVDAIGANILGGKHGMIAFSTLMLHAGNRDALFPFVVNEEIGEQLL